MEFERIFTNRKVLLFILLLLASAAGSYLYVQMQGAFGRDGRQILADRQQQSEYAAAYPGYLLGIIDESDRLSTISIFQKTDAFASRNLQKTKADYEKLRGVITEYGRYDALTTVVSFEPVHYMIFGFVFILVWFLFEDEKKGLWCVSHAAPRGRLQLALRRIGVLAVGSALFVTFVYSLLFSLGLALYGGLEDWGNSIQSVMLFQSCTFRITVAGYVFLYVILHIVLTFAASLLTWMLLLLLRNHLLSAVLLVGVLAAEGILCFALKDQSVMVFLKYENLFRLIYPGDVLYTYRNYNLFGYPVNCFRAVMVMTAVTAGVSMFCCIRITMRRKPVASASKTEIIFMHAVKKLKGCWHRLISGLNVCGLELYKILITQKGILLCLIWLYLHISMLDTNSVFFMGSGAMMQEIYQEYSGPDDGRLREYIAENEEVLKQADAEYEAVLAAYEQGQVDEQQKYSADMKYMTYSMLRQCVSNIKYQLTYMERMKEQKGIDAWFLQDKGYKIILTGDGFYEGAGYGSQETRALLAVLLVVFLLCTVFSYDRSCGMHALMRATPYGRKRLLGMKTGVAALLCLLICAATYGMEWYEVQSVYPLTCLKAPVQSLMFMEEFPFHISIGVFLALVQIIHFVMLFSVGMMVYAFSAYLPVTYGLAAALGALAVPAVLQMLGMQWCGFLSVTQPVVYVEALQEYGFGYSTLIVVVELVIGIGCYFAARYKWCHAD